MRVQDVAVGEFTWRQPSMWKSRYVLTAGDQTVAELQYQGFWQIAARMMGDDGCFDLAARGFWKSVYEITPCGNNQVMAVYHRNLWTGGRLESPFQRELAIRANAWRSEISLTLPENDQVLIRCTRTSIWKVGGMVSLQPGASFLQSLPLTVLVCWFAHVQQYRDQMAAAAA